jgi:tetratricopeptide (TPR) repeat protein
MKQFVFVATLLLTTICYAGVNEDLLPLQQQWATANYELTDSAQQKAFEQLLQDADKLVAAHPNSAEAYICSGIVKSSYAGAKGGLGALSLAKAAKVDLEKALELNPKALNGSAYTSLGTLYSKVPGWPIAFGDDDKAQQLLSKAVKINPDGIDSNYFYGEFLLDEGRYSEAEKFLLTAQQAKPRPNRPLADKGRQLEIQQALATLHDKLKLQENNKKGLAY